MVSKPTEYEKEYFTEHPYKGYWDFPAHAARVNKLINITHPKSVLDVGCGYGYIVRRLLWKGIPAYGCDISEWCEQQAREIIPGHFVRTPADDLSMFKDKQFDVLYCEGVLEHIEEDKIDKVMSEFERVAERRYLQVSYDYHENVRMEPGHICLHDETWWFFRLPLYTWMFAGNTGTDGGNGWMYKG